MNKLAQSNELSILFLSCDKYKDLWKPLFYCVHKYFRQNEYSMYLGSNTLSYKDKKVTTLLSGPDRDWSTSLLKILDQIHTPYIFLWLDDFFPISAINIARFSNVLHFMIKYKAKYVHIGSKPKPDQVIEKGKYGVYEKGAPYRVTTFGVWEVAALKKLLIAGESAWNFEIMGSYRSAYTDGFYCTMKRFVPWLHVVEKGKIFRDAYIYCKENGIILDTEMRSVLSGKKSILSEVQKVYFNTVIKIPWQIRVCIMGIFRKLLISY